MSTTTATPHDGPLGCTHTVRADKAAGRRRAVVGVLDGHGPLDALYPGDDHDADVEVPLPRQHPKILRDGLDADGVEGPPRGVRWVEASGCARSNLCGTPPVHHSRTLTQDF
jgi:hypothetical protein